MKILLLGEYSALHKNLKEGLNELGHNAVVAASSDGFKKIPVDISFDASLPSVFGKVEGRLKTFFSALKLRDFDVVQAINPFLFPKNFFPAKLIFEFIIRNNEKFFLSAAGDDAFFWKHGRKLLKYGPFDDFLKYDMQSESFYMEGNKEYAFNNFLVDQSNGVIPIMYEYEKSYESSAKRLNTIPIPINTEKIVYQDNLINRKISIFHGLNRYGFKGTRHVEQAFGFLRDKYPNDLQLIIAGNLPLHEYLDLMRRTNVVIDQMYSHSLGVNGVYALAMGKIVLGGAEPESLKSHGIDNSPVINLEPNYQSIIEAVEMLLDNRHEIPDRGYNSRKYAESVHGHIIVAKKYIDTWNNN